MEYKALHSLLNKIDSRVSEINASLGDGAAKDYAEYRHSCGVVRGLLTARSEITDLVRIMESDDDERD